jgi:hypothetical protein
MECMPTVDIAAGTQLLLNFATTFFAPNHLDDEGTAQSGDTEKMRKARKLKRNQAAVKTGRKLESDSESEEDNDEGDDEEVDSESDVDSDEKSEEEEEEEEEGSQEEEEEEEEGDDDAVPVELTAAENAKVAVMVVLAKEAKEAKQSKKSKRSNNRASKKKGKTQAAKRTSEKTSTKKKAKEKASKKPSTKRKRDALAVSTGVDMPNPPTRPKIARKAKKAKGAAKKDDEDGASLGDEPSASKPGCCHCGKVNPHRSPSSHNTRHRRY